MQTKRLLIKVSGIVQGIGFRPFVYNLARRFGCTGFVKNTPLGVHIEIEGGDIKIEAFKKELIENPPPLSLIDNVSYQELSKQDSKDFIIKHSSKSNFHNTLISPDIGVCDDCLKELLSKEDRRYNYPFTNCTNCGPRYTIIENLPYDRPSTTMKAFEMCNLCLDEYNNPSNRRFHAQPNACFDCGPHIVLEYSKSGNNNKIKGNTKDSVSLIIDAITSSLERGSIIALKGIGGFHLVVDANNKEAVRRLRERKNREKKPLAVMVLDVEQARNFAYINEKEESSLQDPRKPILLLDKKQDNLFEAVLGSVASKIGVMLPYTPLHYLIMKAFIKCSNHSNPALVMTSANLSDEPIAIENNEAKQRLKNIADIFVFHNREILSRCDDSVLKYAGNTISFIRRSRGYVPLPIDIETPNKKNILALGAELKNTFCLIKNKKAFLSQHIGDLSNYEAYSFFDNAIKHLKNLLDIKNIDMIAYDMHPHYLSSKWAEGIKNIPKLKIQHHHSHLASCMADNSLPNERVIGLIMDGTGYGIDNTIWGGEILIGNYDSFERYLFFEPYPLLGGERAIKDVWLLGFSYLYTAYGGNVPDLPFIKTIQKGKKEIGLMEELLEKKINCPLTSSCGRLFDAVSAIIGVSDKAHYEGEAAIKLMDMAEGKIGAIEKPFHYKIYKNHILLAPLIQSIVNAYLKGGSIREISRRFHYTLVDIFRSALIKVREDKGINKVVISGGVFQNDILLEYLVESLEMEGFNVFTHSKVPCNDGGIALGQASIASFSFGANK